MQYFIRRPWDLPQRKLTPVDVYLRRRQHRREFLRRLGQGIAGAAVAASFSGCGPDEEALSRAGVAEPSALDLGQFYPATRNDEFEYGRPETERLAAARYTNFCEFTASKESWRWVEPFQPYPWQVEVTGLCGKPRTFDLDDLHRLFSLEERAYRHRCVETWAMCVPWTGFRLRKLLAAAEPLPSARFVEFETFNRPEQARRMQTSSGYPWPYTEGLTVEEASNELAFVATGMYGEPLWKQHGAPVRLVIPWKYGFKSIKSIVRIRFTDRQPATFWNTLVPKEYGFTANVDPDVPHPRWSQRQEWMLGTEEKYATVKYNGYGQYVAQLYPS